MTPEQYIRKYAATKTTAEIGFDLKISTWKIRRMRRALKLPSPDRHYRPGTTTPDGPAIKALAERFG